MAIIPLGGTILGTRGEDGYAPALSAGDVLAAVDSHIRSNVRVLPGVSSPSAELSLEDVLNTFDTGSGAVLGGARGIIVLCGTDTLEEVAFALDLLWDHAAPIVITGAMRTPDAAGADGPANLVAALRVAASPSSRHRGALVVMNDEIHAARHVRKLDPGRPSAFASSALGPVGGVTEGRVWFAGRSARPPALDRGAVRRVGRVGLLTFAIGDDGGIVDAAAAAGYEGLVIEGAGGGSVSRRWALSAGRIAERIPVVYASRTGAGPVLTGTYGLPGGEVDLRRRGLVPAGMLDGLKARVLLALLLGAGRRGQGVLDGFSSHAEVVSGDAS